MDLLFLVKVQTLENGVHPNIKAFLMFLVFFFIGAGVRGETNITLGIYLLHSHTMTNKVPQNYLHQRETYIAGHLILNETFHQEIVAPCFFFVQHLDDLLLSTDLILNKEN